MSCHAWKSNRTFNQMSKVLEHLNNDHIWQPSWLKFTMRNLCVQPSHCQEWVKILKVHWFKWASKSEWHLCPRQCVLIQSSGRCNWLWLKFILGCTIDAMTDVQKENYVQKVYRECGWPSYRCTTTKRECL